MVIFGGAQYLGQRNYDQAAALRDTYVGIPTQDQVERQRLAGYEFTGELDGNGRPKWRFDPPLEMKLRNVILFLVNPFDPIRPSGLPAPPPGGQEA